MVVLPVIATAPRLRLRRPSPTVCQFTVTTKPAATLPLVLARGLLLLLRLLLLLGSVAGLYARWSVCPLAAPAPAAPPPRPAALLSVPGLVFGLDAVRRSGPGRRLVAAAATVPLPVFLPAVLALVYLLTLRLYSEESLLVLRGLGIQTSESPASYLAGPATRFVPTEKIQDIFVNEAFCGFQVRYYLVIVVEGEDRLLVVFPGLLPRRDIVETVWRGMRDCLYEGRPEDKSAYQTGSTNF